LQLELRAASEGLDYDAVTARLRDWIDDPPQLDPPRPVSAEAIQVLTVHQAKGLEFPVVVLWDGMGQWNAHESTSPWRVDRDGAGWAMNTNDVRWEEPVGAGMLDKEKTFANAEKQRLVYVAATRARDLLVVPRPAWDQASDKYINARLLADVKEEWVRELDTYVEGKGARWSKNLAAQPTEVRVVSDADVMAKWTTALAGARKPRHVPRAVTALAKTEAAVALRIGEAEMETPPPRPRRIGRYGPIFGETVHRAIGLTLTRGLEPTQAVEQAARAVGLSEHLMEAAADVARALDALRAEGLVGPDRTVRLEYPVAREHGGHIVTGYVDLLSAHGADVVVIDFKTDAWDAGTKHPEYTAQVQAYVQIVGASRGGLLFSAIGRVIWSTPSS